MSEIWQRIHIDKQRSMSSTENAEVCTTAMYQGRLAHFTTKGSQLDTMLLFEISLTRQLQVTSTASLHTQNQRVTYFAIESR